jgi:hypothetical protein
MNSMGEDSDPIYIFLLLFAILVLSFLATTDLKQLRGKLVPQ